MISLRIVYIVVNILVSNRSEIQFARSLTDQVEIAFFKLKFFCYDTTNAFGFHSKILNLLKNKQD